MNFLGWVIFILSNGIVLALVITCFVRFFRRSRVHMHAPLDIDTRDTDHSVQERPEE
jgi:hypothetical protein